MKGDGSGSWVLDRDEFYVRDLSGREIAIYYGSTLQQWNLFGLDQIGHMKSDAGKFFYLKDHLGSTRAIIDTLNQVVSAQDYDPWGYIMENRSYQSEYSKYKFTGKERDRDIESNYDYFGARYYDSRVANWTSIDPLFEKHFDYSPYNYVLRNPYVFIDPDGNQVNIHNINEYKEAFRKSLQRITGYKLGYDEKGDLFVKGKGKNYDKASKTAREIFDKAMKFKINVMLTDLVSYGEYKDGKNEVGLNANDIKNWTNPSNLYGLDKETKGWAMTFLHEIHHTEAYKINGDDGSWEDPGTIEKIINIIREELGEDFGKQMSYVKLNGFIPMDPESWKIMDAWRWKQDFDLPGKLQSERMTNPEIRYIAP